MSLKYVHQLCFWEKILGGKLFLKKKHTNCILINTLYSTKKCTQNVFRKYIFTKNDYVNTTQLKYIQIYLY